MLMLKGRFHKYRRPVAHMGGRRINSVDKIRYLGVTIDECMSYDSHVKSLTDRIKKLFVRSMPLCKVSGGYSCASLRILYKGLNQHLVTYGCELWGAVDLRRKTLARSLLGAQRQILLKVGKAYRTVSGDACCVIVGVIPIDLVIAEQQKIFSDVRRGLSRGDSKLVRRRETMVAWQDRWDAANTGRYTSIFHLSRTE